jgi:hypothetical protein
MIKYEMSFCCSPVQQNLMTTPEWVSYQNSIVNKVGNYNTLIPPTQIHCSNETEHLFHFNEV